jgi:uncharacterized membrane protein
VDEFLGDSLVSSSMPFFTLFVKSLRALLIRFVVYGAASYKNLQTSLIFFNWMHILFVYIYLPLFNLA